MPRRARFTVPDGIYHVMVRGNDRKPVFHDDEDFKVYLEFLKDCKEKYGIKLYHYALMNNHVHLIVESEDGNKLSGFMKRLNVYYVNYYRKKYRGIGHFFQDRFKSFLIQRGRYMLECGRYVELNAVKAGLVEKPEEYHWSSYRVYSEGWKQQLVDLDPEFERLSEDKEQRIKLYRQYVEEVEMEKRDEERFFRAGLYGSKEYTQRLQDEGLRPKWSHKGRPKRKRNA